MGTIELDEVQALLEHVLPDPGGYAQRLLLQVMTRWGQTAGSGPAVPYPGMNAFYTAAAADDVTANETVVTPEQQTASEEPAGINMLLAAALGACGCWGSRTDCHACQGHGFTGWTQPDPELFAEFVLPAIEKLSCSPVASEEQNDIAKASKGNQQDYQTSEGEKE